MAIVEEIAWLGDPAGAVRVKLPGYDLLVVESDWVEVAGQAAQTAGVGFPAVSLQTSATAGVWTTAFAANPARHEAYVCNNHSDPSAVVLVRGGPYPPKAIWPDGPPFVTAVWKGAISVMSPTHTLVRCSGSES